MEIARGRSEVEVEVAHRLMFFQVEVCLLMAFREFEP